MTEPQLNPKHVEPILILFARLEYDKNFLAAYKEMPSKQELEAQCFASFTDLEYNYFKAFGTVEQNSYTYQLQQYFLK